jgi:hypothetical protein
MQVSDGVSLLKGCEGISLINHTSSYQIAEIILEMMLELSNAHYNQQDIRRFFPIRGKFPCQDVV